MNIFIACSRYLTFPYLANLMSDMDFVKLSRGRFILVWSIIQWVSKFTDIRKRLNLDSVYRTWECKFNQNHMWYLKHGRSNQLSESLIWKSRSYRHTEGFMIWNFTTDSCITINSETIDAVKPILKLPWRKNIMERSTNTINASSTVPASIPTIPTVQFRGRTLNVAEDHSPKSLNPQIFKHDKTKNEYLPFMRYTFKSWF